MKKVFFIFAILMVFADICSAQEWVQTNGPGGGFNQIVFNKKKDMFVSAGTLMRSTDNGVTWIQIPPEDSLQIRKWKIAVAPDQDIYSINMDSSHLWKSIDNGNSWKRIYLENISIQSIIISPNGTIFVLGIQSNSSFSSVYFSEDSGKTWVFNPISLHGDGNIITVPKDIVSAIDSNGILLLSYNTKFLCSTDKGNTWEDKDFSSAVISITCGKEGNVFLSTNDSTYRSSDDGLHWSSISLKSDWISKGLRGIFSASPGGRILFAGLNSTLYSDDNGIHWQEWTNRLSNGVLGSIVAPDTDSGFYFCYGEYSVHSEKSTMPWSRVLFPTSTVSEMKSCLDGTILAFDGSIWRLEKEGESWQYIPANVGNVQTRFVIDSEKNILLLQGTGVLLSSDTGKTWDFLSFAVSYGDIYAVCTHPNGTIFTATNEGISVSYNNGIHWDLSPTLNSGILYSLSIDHHGRVYAGGEDNNIYRSVNSGKTWDPLFIRKNVNVINSMVTNMYNDVYFFEEESTMYRSIDLGVTWSPFADGLTCNHVRSLIELPDGSIAAATDNGVFILSLGDCKWKSFSAGLWNLDIRSLTCTPQGELFAATTGAGVFKSTIAFNTVPKLTGRAIAGSIDFGSVAVGDTVCRDIFIKNIGLAPLTITKSFTVVDPMPFSIDPQSIAKLPLTINPNESAWMRVCFHPPQPASYASEIDWSTDIDPSFCEWAEGKSFLHGTTSKSSVRTSVALHSFSINPNPVSGNLLKVSFTEALPQSTVISVFDVLGREMYHNNLAAGQKDFDLPIRELTEGMYYVQIETDGVAETRQFVRVK